MPLGPPGDISRHSQCEALIFCVTLPLVPRASVEHPHPPPFLTFQSCLCPVKRDSLALPPKCGLSFTCLCQRQREAVVFRLSNCGGPAPAPALGPFPPKCMGSSSPLAAPTGPRSPELRPRVTAGCALCGVSPGGRPAPHRCGVVPPESPRCPRAPVPWDSVCAPVGFRPRLRLR